MTFSATVADLSGRRVSGNPHNCFDSALVCRDCENDLFQCTCRRGLNKAVHAASAPIAKVLETNTVVSGQRRVVRELAVLLPTMPSLNAIDEVMVDVVTKETATAEVVPVAETKPDEMVEVVEDNDAKNNDAEDDDDELGDFRNKSPWFSYDDSDEKVGTARIVKIAAREQGYGDFNNTWKGASKARKNWARHGNRIEMKQARREETAAKNREKFVVNRFCLDNLEVIEVAMGGSYKNGRDYSYGANKAARVEIAKVVKDKMIADGQLPEVRELRVPMTATTFSEFLTIEDVVVDSKVKQEREQKLSNCEYMDAMIADAEQACKEIVGDANSPVEQYYRDLELEYCVHGEYGGWNLEGGIWDAEIQRWNRRYEEISSRTFANIVYEMQHLRLNSVDRDEEELDPHDPNAQQTFDDDEDDGYNWLDAVTV